MYDIIIIGGKKIMDEVDYRYKDSIREALQNGNVSRLMELVPALSEQDAQYYIEAWNKNYLETMQKIRNSQDTSDLDDAAHNMLFDLMDKANLSGYHK